MSRSDEIPLVGYVPGRSQAWRRSPKPAQQRLPPDFAPLRCAKRVKPTVGPLKLGNRVGTESLLGETNAISR